MKVFLYSFLLLSLLSCTSKREFAISFGGNNFDESYDIDITSNGDLVLTGIFSDHLIFNNDTVAHSKGSFDIYVIKTNENGILKWAQNIGSIKEDWGYNSVIDLDGNIYGCGSIEKNKNNYPIIFKLNKDGEMQWEKVIQTVGEFINLSIHNNQLIVTGAFQNSENKLFYAFDFDGNTMESLSSNTQFEGRGITSNKDEIILYGASVQNGNKDAQLHFLDKHLKLKKSISFGTKGDDILLDVLEKNNKLYLCGQMEGDTVYYNNRSYPTLSEGGKDGFFLQLLQNDSIYGFKSQSSPKMDWSMNLSNLDSNSLIISTIISQSGFINSIPLSKQKGKFDIALSIIEEDTTKAVKLISSPLEEGVNKVVHSDKMIYLTGWHQGTTLISDAVELHDDGNGNGFIIKIAKDKLFDN